MSKGRKHNKKKKKISSENSVAFNQSAAFKKNKKYLLPLILNTVLFFGLYSILVRVSGTVMMITLWTYFALTIAFSFTYIIYNRGFSRMNVTPEMLPASMSAEEKNEFIENGKQRLEKSKWMLLIIFPLMMTFHLDTVGMYLIEPLLDFTSSISRGKAP